MKRCGERNEDNENTYKIYQKIILLSQMDNDRQSVFMGFR